MVYRNLLSLATLQILERGHAIMIVHHFQKVLQVATRSMKRKFGQQGQTKQKVLSVPGLVFVIFHPCWFTTLPPPKNTQPPFPLRKENQVLPNRIGVSLQHFWNRNKTFRVELPDSAVILARIVVSTKCEDIFEQFETVARRILNKMKSYYFKGGQKFKPLMSNSMVTYEFDLVAPYSRL